jgi:hypothetical protein
MDISSTNSSSSNNEPPVSNYSAAVDAYTQWSNENIVMQHLCNYSTLNELEKEGIQDKTFLEVSCGPCPIGRKLA